MKDTVASTRSGDSGRFILATLDQKSTTVVEISPTEANQDGNQAAQQGFLIAISAGTVAGALQLRQLGAGHRSTVAPDMGTATYQPTLQLLINGDCNN